MKKWVWPYVIITLICMVFSYVYLQFSHGVTSPYMTYLFLFPLVFGVLVGIMFCLFEKRTTDYFWSSHLYHTGLTGMILSSILRGVFDIAGTASIYQTGLMIGGIVMLLCGVVGFVFGKIKQISK